MWKQAAIHQLKGKIQAAGTVLSAISLIALLSGAWWGAATLFPSVIILLAGWMM
jgi:hypothetical protein